MLVLKFNGKEHYVSLYILGSDAVLDGEDFVFFGTLFQSLGRGRVQEQEYALLEKF